MTGLDGDDVTGNPPGAVPQPGAPGSSAGDGQRDNWPRWARRGPMELVACGVITAGILMLLQPFSMTAYTYSFVTTLAGTALFMIVSKFRE